ncbi:MAG: ROK family protein [Clostridia bacterium]|nr:ROK family protein [Clostridia bacterium]
MLYLGIDLGGTNIAVGLVDENGKILHQDSTPTLATRPAEEIVKDMCDTCKKVVADAGYTLDDVEAIGVGCPGTVDNTSGIIAYSNNLPMVQFPMREMIQKHIDKPVNLENDANAAAFGEYIINGNGASNFIFITLGTGIGGGVIIDGKIYRGFNCAGAELGHTTIIMDGEQCSCGKKGCWEAYASVTALIRQTKKAIEENPTSLMAELAKKEGKVSGRTSFDAAKQGDAAAKKVVENYIKYVAEGLNNMLNIFQPEIISVGGGISKEGDYLLGPVKELVYKDDYNKYMPKTKIEVATLFNDAGIIGAAMSAK